MPGIPGCAPRRYTHQEKVTLVTEIDRRYRAGEGTLRAIANALGTTDTSYQNWRRAGIQPAGSLEASPTTPHRIYSPEERQKFLDEVERLRAKGLSIASACKALGISEKSFRKWKQPQTSSSTMRSVEVTALVPFPQPIAPSSAESLTLIAPGGYRIEGLGVENAAALLRALS